MICPMCGRLVRLLLYCLVLCGRYPVRFVTYLARFLLNYDKASRKLWDEMANNIPINFRWVHHRIADGANTLLFFVFFCFF